MSPDRRSRRAEWLALALLLVLGTTVGLWGIGWGRPGPTRREAFPPLSAQGAQRLKELWDRLYQEIWRSHREMRPQEPETYIRGFVEMAPGWDFPPEKLANSCRSFLLQADHPDEKKVFVFLSQMRPWKLEFEPLYVHYGGGFIYPLGAFLKVVSLFGGVRLVPDLTHYLLHAADMGRLYLCGRFFVLIFNIGSLVVLFALGRRWGGWPVGLLAAVFYLLSPIIVQNSHFIKPHTYSAFWALASVWALLQAEESGRKKAYLVSGLCAGLAAAGSLILIILAGLPPLAWLLRLGTGRAERNEWRSAAGGAGLALALCALCNPYLVLAPKDFAWELTIYGPGWDFPTPAGLWALAKSFATGMGGVLAALAGAAIAATPWRRHRGRILTAGIAVLICAWLLMRCSRGDTGPEVLRVYCSAIGLACLLAADLAWSLPRALRFLVLAACLADTGLRAFVNLENMRLDSGPASTRWQAASWIEDNVPAGSRVGLLRYPEPAHTPPFRYDRYQLMIFDSFAALPPGRQPDYLVVDGMSRPQAEGEAGAGWVLAKRFLPYRLGWAKLTEDNIINSEFDVYRREPGRE